MSSQVAQEFYFTLRYALVISLICYLPYWTVSPLWLLLFVLGTMAYRLINAHYRLRPLAKSIRLMLIITCLVLLKAEYGSIISSNFYIGFLVAFVGLKIMEIHSARDFKVLILCNFYLILSALILIQELWMIFYLLIAILANLSLMLKINSPQATLKQIGGRSFRQVLIAIPLSVLLFYLFPRIANPLWQVPSQIQGQKGFSEQMRPGSIAQLFEDDSTAFRVSFKNKPLLNAYWHGLVLSYYNGTSWRSVGQPNYSFLPLSVLITNDAADYEVLLEPHQQKWLFYSDLPVASNPKLLFSPDYGLVNENQVITQRFAYSLQGKTAVYSPLTERARAQNTQLPANLNPQLLAWSKQQYALANQNPQVFVNFIHNYIKQKNFWYSLTPPVLPARNQMDYFWFETQKGFCEHYASAVTYILRSVGIPARVVVGYQGGEWNAVAHYLDVQQNSAHAWLEYWQDGVGWTLLDPTSFIARERIESTILNQQNERYKQIFDYEGYQLSWLQKSRLLIESARFFAERWLLFYNQDAQNRLLQLLGLQDWGMAQLAQAAVGALIVFLILLGSYYQWKHKKTLDPLLREYFLLQKEFRRLKVATSSSITLEKQCKSLINKRPEFTGVVMLFLNRYEQLRLQRNILSKENNKQTQKLFKKLRSQLKVNT